MAKVETEDRYEALENAVDKLHCHMVFYERTGNHAFLWGYYLARYAKDVIMELAKLGIR